MRFRRRAIGPSQPHRPFCIMGKYLFCDIVMEPRKKPSLLPTPLCNYTSTKTLGPNLKPIISINCSLRRFDVACWRNWDWTKRRKTLHPDPCGRRFFSTDCASSSTCCQSRLSLEASSPSMKWQSGPLNSTSGTTTFLRSEHFFTFFSVFEPFDTLMHPSKWLSAGHSPALRALLLSCS